VDRCGSVLQHSHWRPSLVANEGGLAWNFTGLASDGINLGSLGTRDEISIVSVLQQGVGVTVPALAYTSRTTTISSKGIELLTSSGNTEGRAEGRLYTSGGSGMTTTSPHATGLQGRNVTHVLSYKSGVIFHHFIDGFFQGSVTPQAGNLQNTENLFIGYRPPTYWVGQVSLVAVFMRHMEEAEARAISSNPWQLFRADPVRIYSLSSFAPGVPTSLLNQNLAATSFRSAWTAPA